MLQLPEATRQLTGLDYAGKQTANPQRFAMRDFADLARKALRDSGYSMSAAARALNYDLAYLSRVLNRKQAPSEKLAKALDALVGANGELVSQVVATVVPADADERPSLDADIARTKTSAEHLLDHADRYGADTVASAAVQMWQSAQQKLDSGSIPEKEQLRYLSAVSESAEVAGWLLFDAGRWDAARDAFMESHMLATHAGDRAKQWFALDMLAMLHIETARPGAALCIAESVLSENRVPPRVALIAQVRRGRALSLMGDSHRSAADLEAAKAGLEDSLSPRDPWWVWWINSGEVSGHAGQALLRLGKPRNAIPELQYALEGASPRGTLLYRSDLLRAYAEVEAWRQAESELEEIARLLGVISSGRNRRTMRETLRLIERDHAAPARLTSFAGQVRASMA
jgi:tetratricopeptide (TPR) repeat protein